jgi:hypothetical protein
LLGDLDLGIGVSTSRRNYENRALDGQSELLTPDWNAKLRSTVAGGKVDLSYTGNAQKGTREETRTITELDSEGNVIASRDTTDSTSDSNSKNRLNLTIDRKFEKATMTITGGAGKDRFQFISQLDSLAGQQETRTQSDQTARVRLDVTPREGLKFVMDGSVSENESDYLLDRGRFTQTSKRDANADITYNDPLQGA